MDTKNVQIISDPAIIMGKPIIAGTRITVELILEKLTAGETIEQILDAHLRLTREAIHGNEGDDHENMHKFCRMSRPSLIFR